MTRNCIVCQDKADVYCFNDEAYLCYACDEQVHGVNLLARRHNRTRVCELCTAEPSTVYCKNDRAFLCTTCDVSSHSTVVASRHERVPVSMQGELSSHSEGCSQAPGGRSNAKEDSVEITDDDSFLAVPDVPLDDHGVDAFPDWAAPGDCTLFGKGFESNDLDIFDMSPAWLDRLGTGLEDFESSLLDGVVPEVCASPKAEAPALKRAYEPQPEPRRVAPKIERQHALPLNVATEMTPWNVPQEHPVPPFTPLHMRLERPDTDDTLDINNYIPHSFLPMDPRARAEQARDRRARLERFKEKKKNRQFKKTIRYASRKAYAEVRPRIKGRFARKDEVAAMRAAGLLPPIAA